MKPSFCQVNNHGNLCPKQTRLRSIVVPENKMTKRPIVIPTLHCNQCDYDWIPSKVTPKVCPKCKRFSWDEPKKVSSRKKVEPKETANVS
jgi:predicted Zn-ribbon and HTH transcriptional regulator